MIAQSIEGQSHSSRHGTRTTAFRAAVDGRFNSRTILGKDRDIGTRRAGWCCDVAVGDCGGCGAQHKIAGDCRVDAKHCRVCKFTAPGDSDSALDRSLQVRFLDRIDRNVAADCQVGLVDIGYHAADDVISNDMHANTGRIRSRDVSKRRDKVGQGGILINSLPTRCIAVVLCAQIDAAGCAQKSIHTACNSTRCMAGCDSNLLRRPAVHRLPLRCIRIIFRPQIDAGRRSGSNSDIRINLILRAASAALHYSSPTTDRLCSRRGFMLKVRSAQIASSRQTGVVVIVGQRLRDVILQSTDAAIVGGFCSHIKI